MVLGITAILDISEVKAFIQADVNRLLEINTDNHINCDTSTFDFSGLNLFGINFNGAILTYINFTGANLSRADLKVANPTRANLNGANLMGAYFTGADLIFTNLEETDIFRKMS